MVQFLDGSVLDLLLFGIVPAVVIASICLYIHYNKKNKESED